MDSKYLENEEESPCLTTILSVTIFQPRVYKKKSILPLKKTEISFSFQGLLFC